VFFCGDVEAFLFQIRSMLLLAHFSIYLLIWLKIRWVGTAIPPPVFHERDIYLLLLAVEFAKAAAFTFASLLLFPQA